MNKSILSLLCLFFLFNVCMCHMELKFPAPRLSQYAGIWDYTQIDYDMNAPLNMKGNLLCQGKPPMTPTATFTAGQTFTAQIVGGAPHGGGHCQFALSYDAGKTWVVIQDHFRTCPLAGSYSVKIPDTAPASDKVVFAWTWVNAVGNREYYMNCADIIIKNSKASNSLTGKKLLVVNQPGTPTIGEFNGNLETGMSLLNARPTITITVGGGTTTPTTAPTAAPTPTPTQAPTQAPTAAPTQAPTQAPTPTPTQAPTPTPTNPPSTNCKCSWAAFCGADTCGVIGAGSACQCKSGSVCLGGPSYQCRFPGIGGAPVPIPDTPTTTPTPTPTQAPTPTPTNPPSTNCKCLWASYCGADSCGVTGAGSACQCSSGTTCRGAPYFQCR